MLSQRGQGELQDEGPSIVSRLSGRLVLRNGVLDFSDLTLAVPGAIVQLAGTFDLKRDALDFGGHLLLDASLAETTAGIKSGTGESRPTFLPRARRWLKTAHSHFRAPRKACLWTRRQAGAHAGQLSTGRAVSTSLLTRGSQPTQFRWFRSAGFLPMFEAPRSHAAMSHSDATASRHVSCSAQTPGPASSEATDPHARRIDRTAAIRTDPVAPWVSGMVPLLQLSSAC